jgi:RNA polymerase sigma-70 factor (ECF subfamily)
MMSQSTSSYQTNVDAIGLDTIIGELKPDLKEMIDLHYFGGMTQQEIADEKNMPLGSVKTKMRTAMQQLKSIFEIK